MARVLASKSQGCRWRRRWWHSWRWNTWLRRTGRRALATDEAAIVKSMLSKGCSSLCEESLRSQVLPHHSLSSRNAMIKEKDIAIRSNYQEMMHNQAATTFYHWVFFLNILPLFFNPPPLTFLQPPCKFPWNSKPHTPNTIPLILVPNLQTLKLGLNPKPSSGPGFGECKLDLEKSCFLLEKKKYHQYSSNACWQATGSWKSTIIQICVPSPWIFT